jgi:DNA (cytosine-5)-methyltransferase 1
VENSTTTAVMQPVTYDFFNITAPVNRQSREPGDPCHTLARSNAEHAVVMQPVALQDVRAMNKAQNGRGWNDDGTAYTVDTHATQGVAVAFTQNSRSEVRQIGGDGQVVGALAADAGAQQQNYIAFHPTQDPISNTDVCHAIGTGNGQGCATAAVFVQDDTTPKVGDDLANCLRRDAGGEGACVLPPVSMQVRRLTPVECERLQGFPDGYTAIPWRKKPASECPDGPRYKALGNSWAVPVVRWIGRRIAEHLA